MGYIAELEEATENELDSIYEATMEGNGNKACNAMIKIEKEVNNSCWQWKEREKKELE